MKIHTVETDIYDIVEVASRAVSLIDSLAARDEIYVDITTGRKTKSLGLLFGSNARVSRIRRIIYVTAEDKRIVALPKMAFNLTDGQRKVLDYLSQHRAPSISSLADQVGVSRGAIYRHIKELTDMDAIEDSEEGFRLTDFGKILVL